MAAGLGSIRSATGQPATCVPTKLLRGLEEGSVFLHFCFPTGTRGSMCPSLSGLFYSPCLHGERCHARPTQYQTQSWASTFQLKARAGLHPVSLPFLYYLFHAPSGSANRCPRSPWLQPAKTFQAAILFQDGKETYKVNLTCILMLFNSTPDLVMREEKSIPPNVTRKQKQKG